jgi:hypothetical protein
LHQSTQFTVSQLSGKAAGNIDTHAWEIEIASSGQSSKEWRTNIAPPVTIEQHRRAYTKKITQTIERG